MRDYIAFPNDTKHKTTNHKTNFIPSVDNDGSTYQPNKQLQYNMWNILHILFFIIATHNIFQSQRFWLIIHYLGQSKN